MDHPEHSEHSSSVQSYPGNELLQPHSHAGRRRAWPWILILGVLVGAGCFYLLTRWNRPEPLPVILGSRALTHTGHLKVALVLGPDGKTAWYSERDPELRLWRLPLVSGRPQPLAVRSGSNVLIQAVSPDGLHLLVTEFTDHRGNRQTGLWETNVDGSHGNLLVPGGWSGAWSPSGQQLAYSRWDDHGVYLSASDGAGAHRISTLPGFPWFLHWSPHSDRILAISVDAARPHSLLPEGRLYRVRATTGRTRLIQDENGRAVRASNPLFSSDGRYFFVTHLSADVANVWEINRRTGHMLAITTNPVNTWLESPGPRPDQIITAQESVHAHLLRVPPGSRSPQPFPAAVETRDLAFSRDGQWMAWVSLDGALYRARADGSHPVRLLEPSWKVSQPVWAPDSRQLIVSAAPHGGLKKLYRLLAMGSSPNPAPNAITFGGGADRDANWARDQKHVLFRRVISGVSQLEWLDLDSGNLVPLSDSEGKFLPTLSPQGVIAAVDAAGHSLYLRQRLSGPWLRVLNDAHEIQSLHWAPDGQALNLVTGTSPAQWVQFFPATHRLQTLASLGRVSVHTTDHWHSVACTPNGTLVFADDTSSSDFYLLTLGDDQ